MARGIIRQSSRAHSLARQSSLDEVKSFVHVEELADVEHKKLDLQRQEMHIQHKKTDTERLLLLGRLNKEGQLTDIEFAHAKASLLLSQASIGEGHVVGSPMFTTSPTTGLKNVASTNSGPQSGTVFLTKRKSWTLQPLA
jgi:hypothetical protein